MDRLPGHVADMGMSSLALTDHGNISGAYKFYKACKSANIKPIIGMEAYYTVGDRTVRERDELNKAYYHLVLLSKNNNGLHNLIKLSSYAYTEGMYYHPRIDDALLADYSEDIIATSACLGSRSSQLILNGEKKKAEKLLEHHAEIFKDNWLIELQLHKDEEQQIVNKALVEIASKYNWPLVVTADCHYQHLEDKVYHEQTLCMQTNDVMWNPNRFSFGEMNAHVASHDFMARHALLQGIPYEAIKNTRYVADMIDSQSYFSDRKNRYPKYRHVPEGEVSWKHLLDISMKSIRLKLCNKSTRHSLQEYEDRIKYEVSVMKKMDFCDYMLIVKEIVDGARSIEVEVGPGRGSAGGSLVAYALGITQVDPMEYDLIFERFLNPGRSANTLMFDRDMIKQIEEMSTSAHGHHHGCQHHSSSSCSHHKHSKQVSFSKCNVDLRVSEESLNAVKKAFRGKGGCGHQHKVEFRTNLSRLLNSR